VLYFTFGYSLTDLVFVFFNPAVTKLLRDKVAPGAFHDSAERYDPPKCHPGTREMVIKEIMEWIQTVDREQLFLWMYGPAGSGKSAIAQSIAELCARLGLLAASFFFSRTAPGRSDATSLIPTLAYQFTISIPEIAEHIFLAIEKDPLILSRSVKVQLETLILQPLSTLRLDQNRPRGEVEVHPRLIIIDGLDECSNGQTQRYILKTLSFSLQHYSVPLILLIASRPEQEIRDTFNEDETDALTRRLILDDHYVPDADIQLFLISKFEEIKKSHPVRSQLPSSWPSDLEMQTLIQKSSGQFIYASTVVKFVQSPRHQPMGRLNIVVELLSAGTQKPFSELDALYAHIFASAADIDNILDVFTFIFLIHPKGMSGLLGAEMLMHSVEKFLEYKPGDLQLILADLHSVLFVPLPDSREDDLRIYHASLGDFLMDRSRSGNFFIATSKAFARMALHCVKHVSMIPDLLPTSSDLTIYDHNIFSSHFYLSCEHFMDLCATADATHWKELLQALDSFSLDRFLTLPSISDIDGPSFFFQWRLMEKNFPSFMRWLETQVCHLFSMV